MDSSSNVGIPTQSVSIGTLILLAVLTAFSTIKFIYSRMKTSNCAMGSCWSCNVNNSSSRNNTQPHTPAVAALVQPSVAAPPSASAALAVPSSSSAV